MIASHGIFDIFVNFMFQFRPSVTIDKGKLIYRLKEMYDTMT